MPAGVAPECRIGGAVDIRFVGDGDPVIPAIGGIVGGAAAEIAGPANGGLVVVFARHGPNATD